MFPCPSDHIFKSLRDALPLPSEDTPQAYADRDQAAGKQLAELKPVGEHEAVLAVQHIASCAQALDCFRQINLPNTTPERQIQCRAQAMGMMRAAHAALRALQALQFARARSERLQQPAPAPPASAAPAACPRMPTTKCPRRWWCRRWSPAGPNRCGDWIVSRYETICLISKL